MRARARRASAPDREECSAVTPKSKLIPCRPTSSASTSSPHPTPRTSSTRTSRSWHGRTPVTSSPSPNLVEARSPAMQRLARAFVQTASAAHAVVQEPWLGVVARHDGLVRSRLADPHRGLTGPCATGRSSASGEREHLCLHPLLCHGPAPARGPFDPARLYVLDPGQSGAHPRRAAGPHRGLVPTWRPRRRAQRRRGPLPGPDGEYPGHWTWPGAPTLCGRPEPSGAGRGDPRRRGGGVGLPAARQRVTVTLGDLLGVDAKETGARCSGVTQQNRQVLLHRGRAPLRAASEERYGA